MSDDAVTKRQGRSPAYPSVSLATALEKAQAQFDELGRNAAPLALAFKSWGYSPKSSGGRDVRASLRYFGIATFEGEGDKAKVKLTEDALRVITDKREDRSEKDAIIRRLALNPTAHKKLWAHYPPPEGIKSDAHAIHFLMWDVGGFNQTSAETLVAQFKETASFSGLYEPDSVEVIGGSEADESPDLKVEIGDLVNVERGGVLVFPKPVKVTAIEEHDGQVWVWTDGSEAWTEVESVILESKGGEPVAKAPPRPPAPPQGGLFAPKPGLSAAGSVVMRTTVFALPEGDVTITYPAILSDQSRELLRQQIDFALKSMELAIKAASILYPNATVPGETGETGETQFKA